MHKSQKKFHTYMTAGALLLATSAATLSAQTNPGYHPNQGTYNSGNSQYNPQQQSQYNPQQGGYNTGSNYNYAPQQQAPNYAAPSYSYFPYYLPPPTPSQAFPDDAAQNNMYRENQHSPVPY